MSAVNDSSLYVRNRINVVSSNAIIGFFLVIVILIVFLDFRSSFLIAFSIPTSFAITFIVMPFAGVDINAISLAAMIIALGMIVDQAIVISENSIVHMSNGKSKFKAILNGTMEVVMPVSASVLTTVLAFGPMYAMSGMMGKFIYVIPTVIIAALVASLLNSYFILPVHLSRALKPEPAENGKSKSWQDKLFDRITIPYTRIMPIVLKHRYIAILAAIIILVLSIYWGKTRIPFNIFPSSGADTFFVYIELSDDSKFTATEEVVGDIEKHIKEIPKSELNYYTAKIGTDQSYELSKPVGGSEYLAYIQITLVPFSQRNREATVIMEELRKKVLKTAKGYKQIRFELQKKGPPAGKPIELHVHSDNDKNRAYFVKQITEELKNIKGVSDVSTNSKIGREEYKLDIDYKMLATTGLTVKDVASTLRIAFDGVNATSIVRKNEEINIRVRFPKKHRQNIRNVLELHIRNRQGRLIPLKSFARLSTVRAETAIYHRHGDVTTTITAQTDSATSPKKVTDLIIHKYSKKLNNYPDVSFSYGGEAAKSIESVKSLLIAFILGIIAIYLILVLLFNSVTQPVIVLLAIPFGLIGVIWAFYFHGQVFSFLAMLGVIGLSGIVVNNSLMMVEFINKLIAGKAKDGNFRSEDLIEDIVVGATRRLRPIIITTVTTVIGLLPTAYGIGGSDPLIAPMVLAIAWGLLLSTQISLVLIPSFYMANLDGFFLIKYMNGKLRKLKMKITAGKI